ncbi:MAG: hypothetical protein ACAI44_39360 [Candidatus Sericytochromatia bacterium]
MTKTFVFVALGALLLLGLMGLSLLGPADWGNRDPAERARRELSQREGELVLILGFYGFMTEDSYGRQDVYPPKIMDCLSLFLKSDWDDVDRMAKARQEIPTRSNVYTEQPGLDALYVDYSDYTKATDKSSFKGTLVYQALDCKPAAKAPKGKASSKSCSHYKLYATGAEGQLLSPISQ